MRNQFLLQQDPAHLEAMIKTNVHPYVYITKYALLHFKQKASEHSHKNAISYVSSTNAWTDSTYFATYAGTKTHNWVLSRLVRRYI